MIKENIVNAEMLKYFFSVYILKKYKAKEEIKIVDKTNKKVN